MSSNQVYLSNPPLLHPKYRPDIDGLRAIAVMSVVVFHFFPSYLTGGFIGVDVFFVISGYLISTIIFENLDKGTFSFLKFYARRIKRLFPALLIILIFSIILGWYVFLADDYKLLGKHSMGGIGFISNFVLWGESGYFDNAAETKPLLHLWSLGIEEQFYFLWPLLCWFFWQLKFHKSVLLLGLISVSFALNIFMIKTDVVAAFYSPITRFWELLFGGALAMFTIYNKGVIDKFQKNIILVSVISFLGFLILGFGFLVISNTVKFPGFWAIVPVAGSVLIIFSGPNALLNRLLLKNKIVVWFGLISYPLYLWHWPLLTFLRIIERDRLDPFLRLTVIFLSILFAWMTYRFIEQKIRKSEGFKHVGGLLFISFIFFMSSFTIFYKDGFPDRKAVTSSEFTKEVRHQFMGAIWPYTKNDICLSDYPYKDQDNLPWWFCMKSSQNPPTILILGDSYANQLYPGFSSNEKLRHQTILSIGTCSVSNDGIVDLGLKCKDQTRFINKIIKNNQSIKFVILDGISRKPNDNDIARVIQRIKFLESQNIRVIVFTPHIKIGFNPKKCFKTLLKKNKKKCDISADVRKSILDDFNPLLIVINKKHPKVLVFEQNDIFCDRDDDRCSFIRNGLPLHRDKKHISEYGSLLLQDYFTKWSFKNIPSIFN